MKPAQSSIEAMLHYKKDYTSLRRSHYYGYWLRLHTLGFRFVGTKLSRVAKGNVVYLKTHWKFKRDEEKVELIVSRLKATLRIKIDGSVVLKESAVSGSQLEDAFLDYFMAETDQPLFIPRLGHQKKKVRQWQAKWIRHIKENKKWAKKLKAMGIFDSAQLMPVVTRPPRPRAYKSRPPTEKR